LLLKIEINDTPSNLAWNYMRLISIEHCQEKSVPMLYMSVTTTWSSKKWLIEVAPKDDNWSQWPNMFNISR
jgi:hypothetical protein